jgi:hypothetical protein
MGASAGSLQPRATSRLTPFLAVGAASLFGIGLIVNTTFGSVSPTPGIPTGQLTHTAAALLGPSALAAGARTTPIPAATLTPVPGPSPTVAPSLAPGPAATVVVCPTQAEFAKKSGAPVNPVTTEPYCAYTWPYDGTTRQISCPADWECEITPPGQKVVLLEYGPLGSQAGVGGTWRYLLSYPSWDVVQNECTFFPIVRANAEQSGWIARINPPAC